VGPTSSVKLHREFETTDARKGLLRPLSWGDLDDCLEFARGLAEEYAVDVNHGTLIAKAPTREEEMQWLEKVLASIEKGMTVSVAAEVDGEFAGNSEVARGTNPDLNAHGQLAIAVAKPYRGVGVGGMMLKTLVEECRSAGLKTVELAALASNERAIRLYERVGFRRVGIIPKKIRRRGVAIDELIMSMEL
jgi:ribosomal protein S18 acetylase RimI-like enzyme